MSLDSLTSISSQSPEIPTPHVQSIDAPQPPEIESKVSLQSIENLIKKSLQPVLENQQKLHKAMESLSDRVTLLEAKFKIVAAESKVLKAESKILKIEASIKELPTDTESPIAKKVNYYLKFATDANIQKNYKQAIETAKKGLEFGYNDKNMNANFFLILAFAYFELNQYKSSFEAAQNGLKCKCDNENVNAGLYIRMVYVFLIAKNYNRALEAALNALKCEPSKDICAQISIEIADIYHAKGDDKSALEAVQSGIKYGSSDGDINIKLYRRIVPLLAQFKGPSEAIKKGIQGLHCRTSDQKTYQELALFLGDLQKELKASKEEE